MKKIFNILFIGIGLVATSCSELPEYELPYELSPVTEGSLNITTTPENAICPGPVANFTVDSESSVYYVVVPNDSEIDPLTSKEVWDRDMSTDIDQAGTEEVALEGYFTDIRSNDEDFVEGLVPGEEYVIYAVTVNVNGIRSDVVQTATFTMPTMAEIVAGTVATDYTGTPTAFAETAIPFETTLTPEGDGVYSIETLWGPDFIVWATGDPSYSGVFMYPGTITIDPETLSVTVESEDDLGGTGTFDPCTQTFDLDIETALFGEPAVQVNVVLAPTAAEVVE